MATIINWEIKISGIAQDYLSHGRPRWDIPHTKAVVYWAKKIAKAENINQKEARILITAAWLHDIGYSTTGVKAKFDSVYNAKGDHMKSGAIITRKILKDLSYTKGEISEITDLVKYHDNLKRNRSKQMQLLIEADSLGQLDRKRVKPSFNIKDYQRWINTFPNERFHVFKTKKGKKILKYLWKQAANYYHC